MRKEKEKIGTMFETSLAHNGRCSRTLCEDEALVDSSGGDWRRWIARVWKVSLLLLLSEHHRADQNIVDFIWEQRGLVAGRVFIR